MSVAEILTTAVKNITGLNNRVYYAQALKNAAAPFCFWEDSAWDEEDALDGPSGLQSESFLFHVVSSHLSELETLSEALKSQIRALGGTVSGGILIEEVHLSRTSPDLNEREVGLYRRVFLVEVNYQYVQVSDPDTE